MHSKHMEKQSGTLTDPREFSVQSQVVWSFCCPLSLQLAEKIETAGAVFLQVQSLAMICLAVALLRHMVMCRPEPLGIVVCSWEAALRAPKLQDSQRRPWDIEQL